MRVRRLLFSVALMTTTPMLAQNGVVSGIVISADDGQPVVGASVMIQGTKTGTVTDVDGKFTFKNLPASAKKLHISYIGMQPVDATIKDNMKVTMSSNQTLDEVMVVAYGTAKKSSYAGSAALVKSGDIKDLPVVSFEDALTGKVAGVQITNATGQAGSTPSVRIRGIGSMNASNEPLYVVDGVPVNAGNSGQMGDYLYTSNNMMNSLNPEDIESISVLKDAAASSLYGSRAANGVVLITTKKGKAGKPTVELKASWAFTPSWATDNYEPASTQEQVNMLYTVLHNYAAAVQGKTDEQARDYAISKLNKKFNQHGYAFSTTGTGEYENVTISDYNNSGRAGKYFDWDKAYFRTGVYQDYDVSVSGAGNTTNYYTSLAYTKDDGRLKMNGLERFSGRANVSTKVGHFLDLATNVSMSRTSKSGYNDSRTTSENLFMETRNLMWGLYWPTHYDTGEDWTARYGSYGRNNLYYDKQWDNKSTNTRTTASETVTLHLLKGLDLRELASYDYSDIKDHLYYSPLHFNGIATNGEINEMRTSYEKTYSSTTANYSVDFGPHSIQAMAGFEAEKNKTDFTRATGQNLPSTAVKTVSAAGTYTAAGYSWGNSMMSWLSKLDYSYDERYYATVSFRRDGSSKLSKSERWGNFWSVAGAWRIGNEKFMKRYPFVSDLKLRASYGINGTLPTDNYGYINTMSYNATYMGEPGGLITNLANTNLTWETSYSSNIGLDFGFFHQRLRGTVEYFNRDSKNLLQDVPVSTVTGFSSVLENIGRINNHGVEVELDGDIIHNHNLTWSAGFNTTFLSSKVKELYDGEDIIWYDPTGGDSRAQFIYREGQSTLAFYGYEWAGVDPKNGKSVYYVNGTDDKAGDFTFNGRGATYDYTKANYTIIGNGVPDVTGGFNTSVTYKGIDLGLNFIYKLGGNIYDGAYKDVADDGYYWERIRAKSYYENMWTPIHTNGTQPALQGCDQTDAMQYSSRHISSASFIRLKTLTIGYTFPRILLRHLAISSARIYCNMTNLLTFAKYKEADPEVNEYSTRGWETPVGKTFTIGINVKF
jgi:TonB-linked SusC/RagA family outer membrane protein